MKPWQLILNTVRLKKSTHLFQQLFFLHILSSNRAAFQFIYVPYICLVNRPPYSYIISSTPFQYLYETYEALMYKRNSRSTHLSVAAKRPTIMDVVRRRHEKYILCSVKCGPPWLLITGSMGWRTNSFNYLNLNGLKPSRSERIS